MEVAAATINALPKTQENPEKFAKEIMTLAKENPGAAELMARLTEPIADLAAKQGGMGAGAQAGINTLAALVMFYRTLEAAEQKARQG